jgi:UDP-glucose 4-epimerase
MRVVLTGATGFLGSRVLPLLAEHEVLCLSRDPLRVPRQPGVRAIGADLGASGQWVSEIASFAPDWCVHLAWEGLPDYSLGRCRANLDAGIRLLDVVSHAGVRRMVVGGSCWEYGRVSGAIAEDAAPQDTGIFASTKRALLTVLDSVARESSFDYRWARIFFVYGPGQRRQSLLPHLHAAYIAGRPPDVREPAAVQDFVHVDDVAAALVALASADGPSGIYNVGSGEPTAVGEIANRTADHYGQARPFDGLAVGTGFWADTRKTEAATGWRARISIADGIAQTLSALDRAE